MLWVPVPARDSTLTGPPLAIGVLIGTSKVPAAPWLLRDTTPISVSGALTTGVTPTVCEVALMPLALIAVTVQLYCVPFVSPLTTIGATTPLPVALAPAAGTQ